jgi:hypothetical protein
MSSFSTTTKPETRLWISAGRISLSWRSLTDWPHDKVRESLVNLYHFRSDYPGIRHPGTPAHALRSLATRDATLASLLLPSFSGYLTLQVDERAVLGI